MLTVYCIYSSTDGDIGFLYKPSDRMLLGIFTLGYKLAVRNIY